MSRPGRLRADVRGRLSGAVGMRELVDVEARIASLEVAVPENLALETALEDLVTDLERTVAGIVSPAVGEGMGA